jgi:hypothetical protein
MPLLGRVEVAGANIPVLIHVNVLNHLIFAISPADSSRPPWLVPA